MKIIFIVLSVAALVVGGFLLLIRLSISTSKYPIAEYAEGGDRLTLEYHYTTDWGNSRTAVVLFFNSQLVDFRGMLQGHENEGGKVFPVRRADVQQLRSEIVDEENASVLGTIESLRRGAIYFSETAEFKAIQAQHPEVAKYIPWTLWVNPNDFSKAQYARINEMLRKGGRDLLAQQRNAKTSGLGIYEWHSEEPYAIWRTIYFDYAQLQNEVFERKTADKEERIEISPGGQVGFRLQSKKYVAGYGCTLGFLDNTGDTLVVSRAWKYADEAFPVGELSSFRDAQGRTLTDVYHIVEEPEAPENVNH